MVVAALPMYDFPELRTHTDNFWQLIADKLGESGVDAPKVLTRPDDVLALWRDPELVFAQTCGLPFVQKLAGQVSIIGTPDYGISGEKSGWYKSVLIKHCDDTRDDLAAFRGARFVFNDCGSQSGLYAPMYLLLKTFGDAPFFKECVVSGGHRASVSMVASGKADIAAIDVVTWRSMQRFQPDSRFVSVFAQTLSAPGLPYICNISQPVNLITNCVELAIKNLSGPDRLALGLKGFWRSSAKDYQVVSERAAEISTILKMHGLDE